MQSVAKESRGFSFLPGQTQEGGDGSSWESGESSPRFSRLCFSVLLPDPNRCPLFRLREAPSFPGGKDTSSLLISYQELHWVTKFGTSWPVCPGFPPLSVLSGSFRQETIPGSCLPLNACYIVERARALGQVQHVWAVGPWASHLPPLTLRLPACDVETLLPISQSAPRC